MFDLHTHILPGLDDGAADLAESLALAREMVNDGVGVAVATPHVRADFPTTPAQMRAARDLLEAALREEAVPLSVLPGGELALDALLALSSEDRSAFGLGGRSSLLLVEVPYHGWSDAIEDTVAALLASHVTPVLAHPERNPAVQNRPEVLDRLVRAGAVVQLTAASVDGRLGRRCERTSRSLLDRGLAHVVASDAHGRSMRRIGLAHLGDALGDSGLARWLTSDVPSALLTGDPLPSPPVHRRRGWRGMR